MKIFHGTQRSLAWVCSLVCMAGLLLPAGSARAASADGFNLTLSPLPVSLVTKPGQSVSTPIQVQNSGTKPERIKVSLMKFTANGATGQPAIEDPSAHDDFIKWVSFSKTSFIAQPGVFNTITMTIKPPASAAFGYYYAVVFSKDTGNQPVAPNQNQVHGAVASLVLLNVQTGGEKRQLQVTSFISAKNVYQFLPAHFTVTVRNTGNIHTVPGGTIFISRAGSKHFLATLPVNKEQGNVLPKSSRQFAIDWNDGFPNYQIKRQNGQIISDKIGQPVTGLTWNFKNANKLRFGHYTASLTLVYNDGQRDVPLQAETSFWVIPWVPLLIVLVLLGLVGAGLWVVLRATGRRLKKIGKKASPPHEKR